MSILKLLLFFICVLITIQSIQAQTWQYTSPNAHYNGGNVGIGTLSPSSKFHIVDGNNYIRIGDVNGSSTPVIELTDVGPVQIEGYYSDLRFVTSAIERLRITAAGKVGIGTNSPSDLLTLNAGNTRSGICIFSDGDNEVFSDFAFKITSSSSIQAGRAVNWVASHRKDGYFSGTPLGQSSLEFWSDRAGGGYFAPLCFKYNGDIILASSQNATAGNVLIGKTSQTNTSYKLDINGNARANKIVVNTTGADFVFEEDYSLRTLEELQKYIRQNKHLPEIPSAKEMEKEGLDVGDLNIKLLQKVEELTLYLIEQNKKLEEQNRKINEQQREMEVLKRQVQQGKDL